MIQTSRAFEASHLIKNPTMASRKDELLAKKARLAELKRQRELRQEQFASSRQSIGGAEVCTDLLLVEMY